MSVEQQVKEVIARTLSVKAEQVDLEGKLSEEYDMDSTECVDLRVALEKTFGVKIDAAEVTKNSTPQEIVGVVTGKQAGS